MMMTVLKSFCVFNWIKQQKMDFFLSTHLRMRIYSCKLLIFLILSENTLYNIFLWWGKGVTVSHGECVQVWSRFMLGSVRYPHLKGVSEMSKPNNFL